MPFLARRHENTRLLMWILAIPRRIPISQVVCLLRVEELDDVGLLVLVARKICHDSRVILRGAPEHRLGIELAIRTPAILRQHVPPQAGQHIVVVAGVMRHQHVLVVLRRGAQQARAADVDHLNRLFERAIRAANRLLERVQVHDHHVDRLDALLFELPHVLGVVAVGQNRGVDLGVQRLDPAVEHLREAGDVLDERHGNAGIGQRLGGTPGGDDLDAELVVQRPGKLDNPGLVVDADQCPPNLDGIRHDPTRQMKSTVHGASQASPQTKEPQASACAVSPRQSRAAACGCTFLSRLSAQRRGARAGLPANSLARVLLAHL
jgi:hypothetical protein